MASPGRYIRDQISGFSGIFFGLLLIVISVHEERFVPRKKSDGLKAAAGGQELSASLQVETILEVASEHHDRTLYVSSGIKSSELIHGRFEVRFNPTTFKYAPLPSTTENVFDW